MTEPILKVEHLRIEFETRRGILVAVDDISFNVMPGEVFGIDATLSFANDDNGIAGILDEEHPFITIR